MSINVAATDLLASLKAQSLEDPGFTVRNALIDLFVKGEFEALASDGFLEGLKRQAGTEAVGGFLEWLRTSPDVPSYAMNFSRWMYSVLDWTYLAYDECTVQSDDKLRSGAEMLSMVALNPNIQGTTLVADLTLFVRAMYFRLYDDPDVELTRYNTLRVAFPDDMSVQWMHFSLLGGNDCRSDSRFVEFWKRCAERPQYAYLAEGIERFMVPD